MPVGWPRSHPLGGVDLGRAPQLAGAAEAAREVAAPDLGLVGTGLARFASIRLAVV